MSSLTNKKNLEENKENSLNLGSSKTVDTKLNRKGKQALKEDTLDNLENQDEQVEKEIEKAKTCLL